MNRLRALLFGRRLLAAPKAVPPPPSPSPSVNAPKFEPTPEDRKETPPRKTMAELDAELRLKMESISGDGGAAGVEYEDGKAEGLKRGVKDNMFRVI
ncbi:hypothetical protein ACHAQA_006528 [Verticillium albo-atrum]